MKTSRTSAKARRTWFAGVAFPLVLCVLTEKASAEPGPDPLPYPPDRYAGLWAEDGLFGNSSLAGLDKELPPDLPFPFTLSGIAQWRGQPYVYLLDSEGHTRELTVAVPRGELELIEVRFGEGTSGHKALVKYRERLFDLDFDLRKAMIATPDDSDEPEVEEPVWVRVRVRPPETRSALRRSFESRRLHRRADREADEWLEGWFRD